MTEPAALDLAAIKRQAQWVMKRGDSRATYNFAEDCLTLADELERCRAERDALREVVGESLMRARLALTALELLNDGFSDDTDEPDRILAALCSYVVERGAVDPMEVTPLNDALADAIEAAFAKTGWSAWTDREMASVAAHAAAARAILIAADEGHDAETCEACLRRRNANADSA